MSMILLAVEDADRDAPIRELLTAEGWWVTTVGSKEEALRAAADHAPQLLILDRGLRDPAGLLRVFSRQNGGCGVLLLIDQQADGAADLEADGVVARDQPPEELVAGVRGTLDAPRAAQETQDAGESPEEQEDQLTSLEIFGDILEDLRESESAAGVADSTDGDESDGLDEPLDDTAAEVPATGTEAEGQEGEAQEEVADASSESPSSAEEAPAEGVSVEGGTAEEGPVEPPVIEEPPREHDPVEATPAEETVPEDDPVEATPVEASEDELEPDDGGAQQAPVEVPVPSDIDSAPGPLGDVDTAAQDTAEDEPAAPVEAADDQGEAPAGAAHLAPPIPALGPEDGEPTTDLVDEVAGLLDASGDEWAGEDTDSGARLLIDEVLAVSSQVDAAGDAPDSEGEEDTPAEADEESASDADDFERVGAYELLELAEFGDLTERWLARRAGGDGTRVLLERVRFELRNRADVRDAFVEGNSDAAGWEHDNVLTVVDLGREGDLDYVVTEYRPGHSLATVLDRVSRMEGRMPLGISLLLIERIAGALAILDEGPAAARHGWLVPASVWLTEEGDVLLREFGVGRLAALDDSLVREWTDHRFIAPERWSERGDIRGDLYSLGAMFYEMVSGRPVHRASDYAALAEAVQAGPSARAQEVDPTIPSEVDAWVMRLLRRDPADRPQSVAEVLAKIDLALQALPVRPANAELNAYVRQLFAARLPDLPMAAQPVEPEPEPDDEDLVAEEEPAVEGGGLTWWWLLIPLLALLALFVGWKLMGGGEAAALDGVDGAREPVIARLADVGDGRDSTPIRTLQ